jgi:hypothetical protein
MIATKKLKVLEDIKYKNKVDTKNQRSIDWIPT